MNNDDITARLARLEDKVDAVFKSAEKTRKYFLWTGIITIVLFVLPLVGIIFVAPSFLGSYTKSLNDVTGGL
jgi:hypothetical protein